VTKLWAVKSLLDRGSVKVLGQFFMLTLVFNEGGALGTSFVSSTLYLIISILIIPLLFYYLYQYRERKIICWPIAFIAGGAVGNIIDRIRLGRVIDFIDIDFFDFTIFGHHIERWWTFNIADTAISCGIVFLIIVSFIPAKKQEPEATN
jgi:signal peptidase II